VTLSLARPCFVGSSGITRCGVERPVFGPRSKRCIQAYGVFRLHPEGIDADSLELDLIDHGLEEMGEGTGEKGEPQLVIRSAFADFGQLQRALEQRGITPISAELEYIALNPVQLPEDQASEALELVDQLEQDDDVQKVFHNLA
jgi:transcriptional/translational regulatory protein YebC/TACO1